MNNYISPSVFVESVGSANVPIESVSASTGCFLGMAVSGPEYTPVLITSWQNFLDVFAFGVETPFSPDSDLAYTVYGFFQNGGKRCYVVRVVPTDGETPAQRASGTVTEVSSVIFTAKYYGAWANNMTISISTPFEGGISEGTAKMYITVEMSGEVVEKQVVSTDRNSSNCIYSKINSKYFYLNGGGINENNIGKLVSKSVVLSGGSNGNSGDLTDEQYETALTTLDSIEDVNLICAPGQTSQAMQNLLVDYADKRGDVFAILEGLPFNYGSTTSAVKSMRDSITGKNGAFYNTCIKVADPLSKTGAPTDCSPCGHIMGMYARIIQERGVWKAPAGTEAVLKGALDTYSCSQAAVDEFNQKEINVILNKPNYGVVVWGAKSLNTTDDNLKYVSDVLLNMNIKKSIKQATQWAVFEPNNSVLWTKLATTIEAFMDGLYRAGAFYGSEAKEAYYVKCDEELNTEEVRNAGQVICEVGYAANRPAEFVVIRIAHSINA